MTRIYVDLDGVLADFDGQYDKLFDPTTRHKSILWKNIKTVDRWWRHLPLKKDAQQLFDFVSTHHYGMQILTATGHDYEDVSQQKREWCKEHFNLEPEQVITVPSGVEKAAYAKSRYDILIDDTPKVIDAWVAAGGTGILHTDTESTIKQLKEFV